MKCRHCGTQLENVFVDLATAPPSNAYVSASMLQAAERYYPLRVLVCDRCRLVQTEDYAGAEELFSEDYAYFSSYSRSWVSHAHRFVCEMVERLSLGSNSTVVEVAANDGYLLQFVADAGIACYGIEPTRSTADAARAKGLEIIEEFFGETLARSLAGQGRAADLVVANNVLAHVPDINDFVTGFSLLLKPGGVASFEFPHLANLVAETQFDTIYHEHYSYLSLHAVEQIFMANGLRVFDVEQLETHGGSLRVLAERADRPTREITAAVTDLRARERVDGVDTPAYYADFQRRADRLKDEFLEYLLSAKRQGLKVVAYGAAAKGNTLLNYAGVRRDLIAYVVDRNPHKQGKFLPGSRIPIVGEESLQADRPDRIVILPWNLSREITHQLSYARAWGARFVKAVPKLQEFE